VEGILIPIFWIKKLMHEEKIRNLKSGLADSRTCVLSIDIAIWVSWIWAGRREEQPREGAKAS
jgi:hypothetical protein